MRTGRLLGTLSQGQGRLTLLGAIIQNSQSYESAVFNILFPISMEIVYVFVISETLTGKGEGPAGSFS